MDPAKHNGLPVPQRYWAVFTVAVAITMAVLDGAIANVALPTIARDLNADPAASIWVVNAYQLAITISLLPLSSLGEIVEYRRVYRAGLVLFTLASLGCAAADSLTTLTAARIVQGLGAAGMCGLGFGLFQSPNNRAILSAAPPERSGGASGMLGTARMLGQTTGAALVALTFGVVGSGATTMALFLAAGFSAAAAGVSCLRLTRIGARGRRRLPEFERARRHATLK